MTEKIFCDHFFVGGQDGVITLVFRSGSAGVEGSAVGSSTPDVRIEMPIALAFQFHEALENLLSPFAELGALLNVE